MRTFFSGSWLGSARRMVWLPMVAGCAEGMDLYEVPPSGGEWRFEIVESFVDDCEFEDVRSDAPLSPVITVIRVEPDSEGFQVGFDEGDLGACSQNGGWFSCGPAIEREFVSEELHLSKGIIVDGLLDSGTSMEGEFLFDFKCEGEDCVEYTETYGAETCRLEGTFAARYEAATQ